MRDKSPADLSIAIVDDDPDMLEWLENIFLALGVKQVKTYAHAVDALVYLDAWPSSWDLLVLDIYMPGMDGVEFLRELSVRRFDGFVLLLSSATEEFLAAAFNLAQRYGLKTIKPISKPPSVEALKSSLDLVRVYRNDVAAR